MTLGSYLSAIATPLESATSTMNAGLTTSYAASLKARVVSIPLLHAPSLRALIPEISLLNAAIIDSTCRLNHPAAFQALPYCDRTHKQV